MIMERDQTRAIIITFIPLQNNYLWTISENSLMKHDFYENYCCHCYFIIIIDIENTRNNVVSIRINMHVYIFK
jgi:hypothetical protein